MASLGVVLLLGHLFEWEVELSIVTKARTPRMERYLPLDWRLCTQQARFAFCFVLALGFEFSALRILYWHSTGVISSAAFHWSHRCYLEIQKWGSQSYSNVQSFTRRVLHPFFSLWVLEGVEGVPIPAPGNWNTLLSLEGQLFTWTMIELNTQSHTVMSVMLKKAFTRTSAHAATILAMSIPASSNFSLVLYLFRYQEVNSGQLP